MATLYDTLGVHEHATVEEIKRAYRKAAMRWHPDRNHHGEEEVARATFQEIKDAYAILSDAAQRAVYDTVYAEQMRGWQAQQAERSRRQEAHARREEQREAEREAAVRAAEQASYAEMVSLAMRFADQGHNRDVLFGVLLGRKCDARRAAQIADSVAALQSARREAAENATGYAAVDEPADAAEAADGVDVAAGTGATKAAKRTPNAAPNAAPKSASAHESATQRTQTRRASEEEPAADAHPAGALSGLWFQFLNSLRY